LNNYRIGSIILENPYYGSRKPTDQRRSSLAYVTDLFVMGGMLILEAMALLHWCEKVKLTPAILHGFSLGGHMASLAFTNWSKPLSLLSCLSWSTSSTVFCNGVISRTIPWPLLSKQFYEDKAYRLFYDMLVAKEQQQQQQSDITSQREQNILTSVTVEKKRKIFATPFTISKSSSIDPVKDFMRLLMDEFTHLKNYSIPPEQNILNSLFIVGKQDGYVLRDGITNMSDLWTGCDVRYINHGHISAFVFNQSSFNKALHEMLQRQQQNLQQQKQSLYTNDNNTNTSVPLSSPLTSV